MFLFIRERNIFSIYFILISWCSPFNAMFNSEKKLLKWIFLSSQLVCAYHPGKTQYSTALKICNQSKNRSADLLPTDSHRNGGFLYLSQPYIVFGVLSIFLRIPAVFTLLVLHCYIFVVFLWISCIHRNNFLILRGFVNLYIQVSFSLLLLTT